ncbi:methyltransferase, partial [Rhizobium hidalgonense]
DLLDFGCGAGVVGTLIKKIYHAQTVYFLDVDAFAQESTRLTLAANNIALDDTVQIIAGRGVIDAPQNLAAIISNPPF